ncbi:CobW family GTP-binding protein [Ilumatobacter nonamiensis]|uniref:CobW family GTP-binding protein n=1 Tax=Ilumatobacter nonamiensis TaxID=467093 RepID=UPI00034D4608|nr:GTP-binding protein [Ilumatobacter nonamiensis]
MAYQEPEFLPWDGRRVPITFVGGYLGAGKTTAINEILHETDRPIAVIVNDVGAINVDAALVKRRHGDTLELTDGCVCCSAVDGFGAAFDQIRARPEPPDHVIVELSGVAEPANVVPWGSSAGFLLDGVVVVAAVDQLLDATMPEWIRIHLERQLAEADLVVLTKTDLADAAAIEAARARLGDIAPTAPIVDGGRGRREAGALGRFLALGGHRSGDAARVPGPTLFDLHEVNSVPVDGPLDRAGIEALLDSLPRHIGGHIARAKGVIQTPDGPVLVQVVGQRREVTPLLPREFQDPTDLVVISVSAGV